MITFFLLHDINIKTRKTFLRCKMPRWNFLNISHNKNIHLRGQTCCNVNFVQGKNTKNVLISQYAECKIVSEIVYKNIITDIFFKYYWRPHYRENSYHSANLMHALRDKFQNPAIQHEHILLQYLMQGTMKLFCLSKFSISVIIL